MSEVRPDWRDIQNHADVSMHNQRRHIVEQAARPALLGAVLAHQIKHQQSRGLGIRDHRLHLPWRERLDAGPLVHNAGRVGGRAHQQRNTGVDGGSKTGAGDPMLHRFDRGDVPGQIRGLQRRIEPAHLNDRVGELEARGLPSRNVLISIRPLPDQAAVLL